MYRPLWCNTTQVYKICLFSTNKNYFHNSFIRSLRVTYAYFIFAGWFVDRKILITKEVERERRPGEPARESCFTKRLIFHV